MTAGGGGWEPPPPADLSDRLCSVRQPPPTKQQDNTMTTTLAPDLESAARETAGNWRDFDCFCWHRKTDLERPEEWAIFYTHHRDSGLLDQSNAAVIVAAMEKFTKGDDPDVVAEHHHHWAVGWVGGYSIRVYRRNRITRAFRTWHELRGRMAEQAVLDEDDYFRRCYEATIDNISDAAWRVKKSYALPKGWEVKVYHWLAEHAVRKSRTTTTGAATLPRMHLNVRSTPLDSRRVSKKGPARR